MTPRQQRTYYSQYLRWHTQQERIAVRIVRAKLSMLADRVVTRYEQNGGVDLEQSVQPVEFVAMLQAVYTSIGVNAAEREYNRLLPQKSAGVLMLTKDRDVPELPQLPRPSGNNLQVLARSETWRQRMISLTQSSATAARISQMTAHTRQLVRDVLTRGAEQVWDVRKVARKLRSVVADKARALLIARTETTRAANAGHEAGAMSTNITLNKIWIATRDSRTRDAHRAMLSAKPVSRDGFFNVGGRAMKYPGDPAGGAGNTCNCRCTVSYVPATNLFNN